MQSKKLVRQLRYLDNPIRPVFEIIDVPKCERILKTCPECDYSIAWDKQNAGVFINCCMCFHLHSTSKVIACMAIVNEIKHEMRSRDIEKSRFEPALNHCRDRDKIQYANWESLPIETLETLLAKIKKMEDAIA